MRQFILKIIFGVATAGVCVVGAGCADSGKKPPEQQPQNPMSVLVPPATQPASRPETYEHKEHTEDVKTGEPKIVVQ